MLFGFVRRKTSAGGAGEVQSSSSYGTAKDERTSLTLVSKRVGPRGSDAPWTKREDGCEDS